MNASLLAAALTAFSGMLGLCLGLERHHKQLLARTPTCATLRGLRAVGWLGLASSLACCIANWGWAMGPVGWLGMLSACGLALVMWAPYAPRALLALAGAGWLVLGVMALVC